MLEQPTWTQIFTFKKKQNKTWVVGCQADVTTDLRLYSDRTSPHLPRYTESGATDLWTDKCDNVDIFLVNSNPTLLYDLDDFSCLWLVFLSHSCEVFVALYNAGLLSSGAVRWDRLVWGCYSWCIFWAVGPFSPFSGVLSHASSVQQLHLPWEKLLPPTREGGFLTAGPDAAQSYFFVYLL